jgi:hypothetical protein
VSDDLKYKIGTEGDDSGANKVAKALAKVREEADKLNSKGFKDLLSKGAELASYAAAVEALKISIEEYAAAEQEVASLDAALAARAQLVGNYRVELQKLAETQQELTGVSSGEWLRVLTTLTQSGGDSENIDKLVEATKNLAGILDGDLQSAAFAVGKALNGEFAAFTRLGIVIDETAPKAKRLDELFEQLAQRGGGQLEARTETLRGAFGQLKNATLDLGKGVGGALVQILPVRETVVAVAGAVKWMSGIFGQTIPQSERLRNAVIKTGAAMESQEDIIKRYTKNYEALKNAAAAAANELDRALASIKAKADQEKGVKNANADALLKRIDEDEKSGRISPTEAAKRRAQIKKDADDENFKRGKDARDKEIGLVQGRADSITKQVDEANKNAADEKKKLEDMQALARQRALVQKQGEMKVGTAQHLYEQGRISKADFEKIQKQARMDLIGFDIEHGIKDGKLDIQSQATKAKQAKDLADKANKELYPEGTALRARAIELQREQGAEMRKHGWVVEANREDAYAALKEARAKELGEVKRNPDGSLVGTPAAVKHQQDIDAATKNTPQYPEGSPAAKAALAARDLQIKQLKDIVDALSKLATLSIGQQARLKAAIDRIDVLEAQSRNNPQR